MNLLEHDHHRGELRASEEQLVRKYLTSNGWKYTSNHPGSIWLWTKEIEWRITVDGSGEPPAKRLYAVDEATAVQIQRYMELQERGFETHDVECRVFDTFDWSDCDCSNLADGVAND